jgi:hypothetical protein
MVQRRLETFPETESQDVLETVTSDACHREHDVNIQVHTGVGYEEVERLMGFRTAFDASDSL